MKLFKYETLGSQIAFIKQSSVSRKKSSASHCLNQFLVVASGRSDGNSQGCRPHHKKGCTGDGCENQQHGGQHQKRRTPLFPAPQRQICRDLQTV